MTKSIWRKYFVKKYLYVKRESQLTFYTVPLVTVLLQLEKNGQKVRPTHETMKSKTRQQLFWYHVLGIGRAINSSPQYIYESSLAQLIIYSRCYRNFNAEKFPENIGKHWNLSNPANIYLFKIKSANRRTMHEIWPKLTIKTTVKFIVNFVIKFLLLSLLLT